jgi:hypothetical protein
MVNDYELPATANKYESRVTGDERRIMQNKPNFRKPQMNLSAVKTINYEQITMTNPNNKPNQTQFLLQFAPMNRKYS